MSPKNKHVKYLLCVIDVFTKFTKSLKDKGNFIEIVNESNHKPNTLKIDQGREFKNKLMQEQ